MMIKPFIFLCLVSLTTTISAQDTTVYFINAKGKETKSEKAVLKREIIHFPKRYTVIDTKVDGDTLKISNLSSLELNIENGLTKYFGDNSEIKAVGYYSNGYLDGLWQISRIGKHKTDTISYIGIREFYENQTPSNQSLTTYLVVEEMPTFLYDNSLIIARANKVETAAKTWALMQSIKDQNNPLYLKTRDSYIKVQSEKTDIEKQSFKKFVSDHQFYPIRAKDQNIKGTVYVEVVIDENGILVEPRILKGVNKDLDFEALRLIINAPVWIPGKMKGEPVRVSMVIPIEFI